MNAQLIAALGEITQKAIADAVAPLHERIKELEARPVHQPYDDSEMKAAFSEQGQRVASIVDALAARKEYDDTEVRELLQSLGDAVKAIPAPYDDSDLRKSVDQVEASMPKPYDDSELREMVKEVGAAVQLIPAPYDDAELRKYVQQGVEAASKKAADAFGMIPKAYDDTALRESLTALEQGLARHAESFDVRMKQVEARPIPVAPQDGRDALHLEILPAIDEAKSYTRNTYAKHAGGLWRSFEQTSGMRGWECIVNGVSDIESKWEGKTLVQTTTLSDGTCQEVRKFFPVAEYKGVFNEGDYEQGDTVTWAGSLWNCNETGTKAKPGDGSKDWTLAVKKGRDGKESVSIKRADGPVHLNPLASLNNFIEGDKGDLPPMESEWIFGGPK